MTSRKEVERVFLESSMHTKKSWPMMVFQEILHAKESNNNVQFSPISKSLYAFLLPKFPHFSINIQFHYSFQFTPCSPRRNIQHHNSQVVKGTPSSWQFQCGVALYITLYYDWFTLQSFLCNLWNGFCLAHKKKKKNQLDIKIR